MRTAPGYTTCIYAHHVFTALLVDIEDAESQLEGDRARRLRRMRVQTHQGNASEERESIDRRLVGRK